MTAIIFFLVGFIVAMVQDFTLLLIGRSLQGAGGRGIVAMTEIVVTGALQYVRQMLLC